MEEATPKRVMPVPVLRDEEFLLAIYEELVGLRADMAKYGIPPRVGPGEVEVTVELREGADMVKAVEAAGQELGEALATEEVTSAPEPEPEAAPEPKRKRRKG